MDELLQELALLKDRIYDLELRHARHKHLGDVDQTQKLASSATTPGGADTEVQYNDGGVFGGDVNFLWDKTLKELYLKGNAEIFAGNKTGTDNGDTLSVLSGQSGLSGGNGGQMLLGAGSSRGGDGKGGALSLYSGDGHGAGDGGNIAIGAGGAGGTLGTGGTVQIIAGDGGDGGGIDIRAGGSTAAATAGSDFNVIVGAGNGAKNGNAVFNLGGGTTIGNEGLFRIIGSPAGNGPHTVRQIFTIRTTDATPSAHSFLTLPVSRSTFVEVRISARRTGGSAGTDGDSAGYVRRAAYKRSSAGTTTLIGAVQDGFTVEDQAAWDATLVISTNDIQVQVTGAANNNIDWICEVVRVSQSDFT